MNLQPQACYIIAALALATALWLTYHLWRTVWDMRRYPWTCGELAGFALCCSLPLALVGAAATCVLMAAK